MIQWCSWSKVDEINKDKIKEEILSIRDQIEVHLNRQSKKL
jgi:hypothetical protein